MAKKTNKTSHVLSQVHSRQLRLLAKHSCLLQLPVKHSRKDQLLKNR